jgi:hypothetical protein
MTSYIASARKDLRLPLLMEAQLAVASVGCPAQTADVGARGCRLQAPMRFLTGTRLRLLLVPAGGATGSLAVGARVVWRRELPAWSYGLAFAGADWARAAEWFDEVVSVNTGLLHFDLVPDQIQLEDRVYVARAPRSPPSVDEAQVLRMACRRASVADLRLALGSRWSRAQRALFALLSSGVLAIDRAGAEL